MSSATAADQYSCEVCTYIQSTTAKQCDIVSSFVSIWRIHQCLETMLRFQCGTSNPNRSKGVQRTNFADAHQDIATCPQCQLITIGVHIRSTLNCDTYLCLFFNASLQFVNSAAIILMITLRYNQKRDRVFHRMIKTMHIQTNTPRKILAQHQRQVAHQGQSMLLKMQWMMTNWNRTTNNTFNW